MHLELIDMYRYVYYICLPISVMNSERIWFFKQHLQTSPCFSRSLHG